MRRTVLAFIGLSTLALTACGATGEDGAAADHQATPAAAAVVTAATASPTSIIGVAPATARGAALPATGQASATAAIATDEELAQVAADIDALDQELAGLDPTTVQEDNA